MFTPSVAEVLTLLNSSLSPLQESQMQIELAIDQSAIEQIQETWQ